jgi:hypothetical protein
MLMHLLSHNMARRSTTTLNIGPPLLELQFGFLLDTSVHFAVKFMLFSICNIPTDQPAVGRAKGANAALLVSRLKGENTSITQTTLTNHSRLAKAVDPSTSIAFRSNVKLLMHSG